MVARVIKIAGMPWQKVAMDLLVSVESAHHALPFQVVKFGHVDVRECRFKNGVCLRVLKSHFGASNRLEGFHLDSPGAFVSSS